MANLIGTIGVALLLGAFLLNLLKRTSYALGRKALNPA